MQLFKGYVLTKNKHCLTKFKNVNINDLLPLEEAEKRPEYAGILADDVILIDVDDTEQAEVLMDIVEEYQLNCRVYQTTRGKHFFFKNPGINKSGTNMKLACGITADIKVGSKNSYAVLKYKNIPRHIEWDINANEKYQTVPFFLCPVSTQIELFNLCAGDGRNDALFRYILVLLNAGFAKNDIKALIRMINKFVFKESLPNSELEKILRDDSFPEITPQFFDGKNFRHDIMGNYLIEKFHIKRIYDQLFCYSDGVYTPAQYEIEKEIINQIQTIKEKSRREVLKFIQIMSDDAVPSDYNLIAFKNGIYNVKTGQLESFSPNTIITNKINFVYTPTAYSEIVDKTLNDWACNDKEIRSLLEECIGYCFYKSTKNNKAFILLGDKANGKSTFLATLRYLLGEHNTSSIDLSDLSGRFNTACLMNKLANIGDDIGSDYIHSKQASVIKKLTSGDELKGEFKNQTPFTFKSYAKLIFSANDMPRISDPTGAVLRRLIIIPFNGYFTPDSENYDINLKEKLRQPEAMMYFVRLGIEGLKRVIENRGFTDSYAVKQELLKFDLDNDPIKSFFDEQEENYILRESIADIYHAYTVYCMDNNYYPECRNKFTRRCKMLFGVENYITSVSGKSVRLFRKV